MRLLALTLLFLAQSTFASSYAEGFMEQICTGIHETISEQIPAEVLDTQSPNPELTPTRGDYAYSPASSDTVIKNTCTVLSSSDISLSFEQEINFSRQGKSLNNSVLKANFQCFFTSNYDWKCGYSQINLSSIDVNWQYIRKCGSFGWDRCRYHGVSVWPSNNWQPAVLEKIQSILDSNF